MYFIERTFIKKGFIKVGGFQSMIQQFSYSIPSSSLYSNTSCGLPKDDYLNLIRDAQSDFPWPGMSLGLLFIAVWYWCSEYIF